jgi:hypothetical protein
VAEKLSAEDGIGRAIEIIEAAMVMHPVQRDRAVVAEFAAGIAS